MNKEYSDEYLMTCFRDHGDYRYLEALTERYNAPAYNFAKQFLFDRENAEDAVQETFIKILRGSERYDSAHAFAPWFYRILRNTCFDMLRKRKVYDDYMEKYGANVPQSVAPAPEPASVSREYLACLTKEEREIVLLKVVDDLSFDDIAKAAGCSVEAAKKRAQRALGRLRTFAFKQETEAAALGT